MRPVTLFTGQWADLPLAKLLPRVKSMGYDGVELACWGDHFDVARAASDKTYVQSLWKLLAEHDLGCWAISSHLVGQATCDRVDERHRAILPAHVWGDGRPEGVNERACAELALTAKAARAFLGAGKSAMRGRPAGSGKAVVNGFTGSPIWHALYAFPPTSQEYVQAGFDLVGRRWRKILRSFDEHDVHFALEVHPTEIAFDIASAQRTLKAVGNHRRFGFNFDPSHLAYQGVDYIRFIREFGDRIHHAHMKDVWWGKGDGTVGVFGGHTAFGDPRRHWDFRSLGRGQVDFESIIVALNDVGYAGPLSVEWEDARMDRLHGAAESCAFVRRLQFPANTAAFDAAFDRKRQGGR